MRFHSSKLLIVALVGVVVTSGCLGGSVSKDVENAQQIRQRSLSAVENVNSYTFDMNTTMEMETSSDAGGRSVTVSMSGDGKVSISEKKMEMDMAAGFAGFDMDMKMYLVGGTVYMKMEGRRGGGRWVKMDSRFDKMWKRQNMLERQERLLNISEVKYSGDGTANGKDAYVLTVNPDPEKYTKMVMNQLSSTQFGSSSSAFSTDSVEVTEISAKQWIAKDSNYPLKSEVDLSMKMDASALGASANQDVTADLSMTVTLSDINEPVSIQVPSAAKNAREFGGSGFDSGMGS